MAGGLAGPPLDDTRALGRATEDIGTGIDWVPEDLQHRMVGRRPPLDLAYAAVITPDDRQLKVLIPRPEQHLACASELLELVEQQPNSTVDALVRVHLD